MKRCVPRSMPLAQRRSDGARGRAHLLRRHRQQDRLIARKLASCRRDVDALIDLHARQAQRLPRLREHIRGGAVAGGKQHRAARARNHVRKGSAPRACSDDGDAFECHARSV